MNILLSPKAKLDDRTGRHRHHAVVCQYNDPVDTLYVYSSPHSWMRMATALMVDESGQGKLGEEASHMLLALLQLKTMPVLDGVPQSSSSSPKSVQSAA